MHKFKVLLSQELNTELNLSLLSTITYDNSTAKSCIRKLEDDYKMNRSK